MKILICFFCFFSSTFHLMAKEEDSYRRNIDAAVDLCLDTNSDTGFLAAKVVLNNCKDDFYASLLLKCFMCFCSVSIEYEDEMLKIADDVINGPSPSLPTAIACYRKGDISLKRGEYKKALSFFDIALHFFKLVEYKKIEGKLCWREFHEFLCHDAKIICFKRMNRLSDCISSLNFMIENYKWMGEEFINQRKDFVNK